MGETEKNQNKNRSNFVNIAFFGNFWRSKDDDKNLFNIKQKQSNQKKIVYIIKSIETQMSSKTKQSKEQELKIVTCFSR